METRPKVITWYNVYLWTLAVMYALAASAGVALFFVPATQLGMDDTEKIILAFVCLVVSVPLAVASLLPFAVNAKPWLWIYGIVMIAIGLTSCCFWPLCIPLLVAWIKPDVQRYFGRDA